MTERIQNFRRYFVDERKHHTFRKEKGDPYVLAKKFQKQGMSDLDRAVARQKYVLEQEEAIVFDDERIAFLRTVQTIPELFTGEELKELKEKHWIHERGDLSNINVDYSKLLDCGIEAKIAEIGRYIENYKQKGNEEAVHYLLGQQSILVSLLDLSERYLLAAKKAGNDVLVESLSQVPAKAPRNLLEALQMLRIIHYVMWCGGNYHNTLGRFDQYIYPYLKQDMDKGLCTYDEALELVEEFFLSLNRDSDLYPGMQQGDNGQSMVLGGLNPDGSDSYNLLSELSLKASLELKLIDPKINLRIHENTPKALYALGTQLTKQGLGFPQYSNDEVVIPGLIDLGYEKEDAYNYVVAACWEYIIPGLAMDIPNIEALSFMDAVMKSVFEDLASSKDYAGFENSVQEKIKAQADVLCEKIKNLYVFPAPFLSLMMEGCTEKARDVSLGCKYNNFGFHGTGLATAVDSLAAIKQYIFDEKSLSVEDLLDALRSNYEGYTDLQAKLRYEAPKMGNNIDWVDNIAVGLLEAFSEALKGKKNERGGIFRAGTGSAMYYIWHAKDMPASPDGRKNGEAFSANYSPSLISRCKGPVSIIQSFAKPDMKKTINGGPLTLELHDTVFRNDESIQKVSMLIKSYMDLGGAQLQLNAVNRDTLLNAQQNPEQYRNLIVRVWGWSGYFVELDKEYQDHIIQRTELVV